LRDHSDACRTSSEPNWRFEIEPRETPPLGPKRRAILQGQRPIAWFGIVPRATPAPAVLRVRGGYRRRREGARVGLSGSSVRRYGGQWVAQHYSEQSTPVLP